MGLAAAAQLSFNYTLTELVPIKHRFYVLTGIFLVAAPFSAFGPWIARLMIVNTDLGWRWIYYANLIASWFHPHALVEGRILTPVRWYLTHLLYGLLPSSRLLRAPQPSPNQMARDQRIGLHWNLPLYCWIDAFLDGSFLGRSSLSLELSTCYRNDHHWDPGLGCFRSLWYDCCLSSVLAGY